MSTIFTNHPNFQSFVKNEIDTLNYLTKYDCIKDYYELTTALSSANAMYTSRLKKGNLQDFDFHAKFEMTVQGRQRSVLVGANVKNNFSECSYFLALTGRNDDNKLIRKFHFDYADKSNPTNQNVPSFHLQYGGKMSPSMKADGIDDAKLDNWLSIPRLNFHPMNLALLLDLMFCEFDNSYTKKIVEASEWRDLIFKNECFLSKIYFENIHNYIDSASYKKTRLIRDFCYGN